MKAIIPEQSWIHQPTVNELRVENASLRDSRFGWRVAAALGWIMFALAVYLA